ncbi:ABC transporter ATP-binding protein [Parasphaerochaeta coccoides]|uniref:Oligopeptide/dipeptide ABC transporter, ATPase subunit n=1 Tax=Parasphaerochaeta coccoides (strain ATCC BAA-1237 / DSM 17374 / SPN1) TaxID=760011 RepID=F4GLL7_PARC1|nr:ABC transporter ATP-binding protein [Parasphaerochaeta coccoides]AEC02411.1 oligopeptide/dipeptide ABC transporter, ATPase subunit [Parasphaerochaeta coccoides DSM 17374]
MNIKKENTEKTAHLLEVKDLRTYFLTDAGIVKAVDGISFTVDEGETLALVGESGCGKSVTNLSIMRLVPSPPGKIVGGEVLFEGKDILKLSEGELRGIRGNKISMIFQDPMTSLNPFLRISTQMTETILLHNKDITKKAALQKSIEMLQLVGIPSPEKRIRNYPHQFSGGMRQRVMIAMALSCNAQLLIADEPTTALDVTIQAQILELIKSLSTKLRTAVILITHDLGVVAGMCDVVCVMYAGRIVEKAMTDDLYANPAHPYTEGLINSVPRMDLRGKDERLFSIEGQPPNVIDLPPCCPFHPRCHKAMDVCKHVYPPAVTVGTGHETACWLYNDEQTVADALAKVAETAEMAKSTQETPR